MTSRHPSRKTKQYLAPTQPEFPAPQPLAEAPHKLAGGEKPSSTVPSPGKSQRGRYAVHEKRSPAADVEGLVRKLAASAPEARILAAKALKAYAADAEKAREVASLLPPDSPANNLISSVRAHCIALIRKEIR